MRLTYKSVSLPVDDRGTFDGYLTTFGNVDSDGDIITPKTFQKSMKAFKLSDSVPALLWNHDINEPVGDIEFLTQDAKGIKLAGKLWVDSPTPAVTKAYKVATGRGPKGMSAGFIVKGATKRTDGPGRVITDADLMEVSVVQYPANDQAVITSAKSISFLDPQGSLVDIRTMEALLRDAGLSIHQSKAFLAGGYRSMLRDAEQMVDNEQAIRYAAETAMRLKVALESMFPTNQQTP